MSTTAAATFTVVSSSSITATIPTGATTGKISVTAAGVTVQSSATFTVVAAPTITSFTPTSGAIGATVVITGTNFTAASAVKINTTAAATFTVVSASTINATLGSGTTSGKISVTAAGVTAVSTATFTVVAAPTITSFTPTSGAIGSTVTITGTNFTGASAVIFNTTNATTFTVASATSITAVVPTGATTGKISITAAGVTAVSSGAFTVIAAPAITSFTPPSGSVGTSVTITGANLASATSVKFNGTTATPTSDTATTIVVPVPTGATTGTISVTTTGGTATSSTSFTVVLAPTISSFTPPSGPVGTSVTITGANLASATAVKFNGTTATPTSDTATTIVVPVPTGATTGTISVTTAGGTATSSTSFTVVPAPTITSFTPSSGLVSTSVTIAGTNLTSATSVEFNGTVATPTSDTATKIVVPVPAGATTGKISVTTAGGTAISTSSFTVTLPPAPTGVGASQDDNAIDVYWNFSSGATSFNVYRATISGGEGSSPTYSGITTNSCIDSAVTPGVTYYYEVTAVGASGESAKSAETHFTAPTPPTAPTGLAVNSITPTTASFTWNAVSGINLYGVFCSLTSGGEANPAVFTYTSTNSATITGLTPVTTYYAVVESENSAGALSGFSNEVSFTTIIASVTNLTAVWQSNAAVLNWTGSYGATSYAIYRNQNPEQGGTPIASTSGTTYTDSTAGAQPLGSDFTYYVVATCATSSDPNPPNITIQAPIAAPVVTATGGYETVSLNWPAPPGGDSYIIKRSTTSGGPYSVDTNGWFSTIGNSVTFTDRELADNTTYYYIVGSEYLNGTNNYGESDSSQVSATTAPATPPSLTATASVDRGVVLTWPASAGATSYNIYESTVSGGVYGQYNSVGSSSSATCTVTGLADSTTYYFVVTAQNSAGTVSNRSPEANATTWPPTPYLTDVTGNASVTLNWTSVPGVLGYTVYRSAWNEFGFANISGMTLLTGTSYVDNTVSNGVEYFYVVTYTNSYGESEYSNVVDAIPNSSSSGNAVYQLNCGGPAVGTWLADTSGQSSYGTTNTIDLSKAVNPAPEAVYQTCGVSNFPLTYTVPGLTPNAAYTVRLHFGDAYDTLPGQRGVNVSLQGSVVVSGYDLIQVAGGPNIATVLQLNTVADSSGNIAVSLTGIYNYPILSGLEVLNGSSVSSAPFNLHALPGHAQVVLTWNGYAGMSGYNVYRGTTSGGPYTLITSTPVAGATYTDTTAVNGTTYYYVVTAVNSIGESLRSNEAYATPEAVNASCYRINLGGPAIGNWVGDIQGYIASSTTAPDLTGLFQPGAVCRLSNVRVWIDQPYADQSGSWRELRPAAAFRQL